MNVLPKQTFLIARIPSTNRPEVTIAGHSQLITEILHHEGSASSRGICEQIAKRPGAIAGVHGLSSGETAVALERLVIERALSVNTAAAGGNASLMTIG